MVSSLPLPAVEADSSGHAYPSAPSSTPTSHAPTVRLPCTFYGPRARWPGFFELRLRCCVYVVGVGALDEGRPTTESMADDEDATGDGRTLSRYEPTNVCVVLILIWLGIYHYFLQVLQVRTHATARKIVLLYGWYTLRIF
ncbi:hypothetical protein C8J57DRAFT_1511066 [Mycena rebaudengoi]|nr:hypothetical protein C8J57DRAFT_1511066 [Mycena rebaudengoi]